MLNIERKLQGLLVKCNALIFHLNAIEEEEDVEMINLHLDCMDEIHGDDGSLSARESARIGQGDFKRVQAKLIRLGIV